MTLQQFLLVLRARIRVFLYILVGTIALTVLITLLMPKTYVATATLIVDSKDAQSMQAAGPMSHPQQLNYLQTQAEVVSSEKVARRVVQALGLVNNPDVQEAFAKVNDGDASIEDWLVESLLVNLKVETSQSNIIKVSYTATSPKFAAGVANAFARGYLETALDLRTEPAKSSAEWFDNQIKTLRANLQTAQDKLAKYQKDQGMVANDERYDVESSRLAELSTQLLRAKDETYAVTGRQREAQELLGRGGALDSLPEVYSSPYIQALKTALSGAEAKMAQISTSLGPNHPEYIRQASELKGLKDRLDVETRKALTSLDTAARQSRAREAELAAALAAQRNSVLGMKQSYHQATLLAREVEIAQGAYQSAMQRFMANRIESRAEQTNVMQLDAAKAPMRASKPKPMINVALSVVVGILLGGAMVLLLEIIDPRVRTRADLEAAVEVPSLGVLHAWRPRLGQTFDALPGARQLLPRID